jgi:glycosyltransferase involved in cell wall biosynthesis
MSAANPAISVVMSVYNGDRFLRQAVDSVLSQSFADFEFLIADDGSRDRSLAILQDYAAKDGRIRLVQQENRGLTRTLNALIQQARGELIARMDADDVCLPQRFALQVEFLRQHPEVVCVGGAQEWIDEAGRVLGHNPEAEDDAEIQCRLLRGWTAINHPSAMMRRSAVLQVGGYDETMTSAQDIDLWLKLGEIGRLANLPQTVLLYRQHSYAISEHRQLEQIQRKREACERAWQRRGIAGQFAETQPWRPVDRSSRHQFILRYGWQFFNTRQRRAAIAYACKAIGTLPLNKEGWRLLVCSLIKPLPEPELK